MARSGAVCRPSLCVCAATSSNTDSLPSAGPLPPSRARGIDEKPWLSDRAAWGNRPAVLPF